MQLLSKGLLGGVEIDDDGDGNEYDVSVDISATVGSAAGSVVVESNTDTYGMVRIRLEKTKLPLGLMWQ